MGIMNDAWSFLANLKGLYLALQGFYWILVCFLYIYIFFFLLKILRKIPWPTLAWGVLDTVLKNIISWCIPTSSSSIKSGVRRFFKDKTLHIINIGGKISRSDLYPFSCQVEEEEGYIYREKTHKANTSNGNNKISDVTINGS